MNTLDDRPSDTAPPAVFDEVTGRPLNDRARALVGEEPRGYDECVSLDDAIHASQASAASAAIKAPASFDEWVELLTALTSDAEKPARPNAVDALHRALSAAAEEPIEYVDAIAQWISGRMAYQRKTKAGGPGELSPHVVLKSLKVVISLLQGAVVDDAAAGEQPPGGKSCVSMPSIWSTPKTASELTGSLTDGSRAGEGGASTGEAFAVGVRAHCLPQIARFSEYEGKPDPQWGDRPFQMIRAAARGAMIRCVVCLPGTGCNHPWLAGLGHRLPL